MQRFLRIMAVAVLVLVASGVARATWYTVTFSEEDLWNHTPSSDTRIYNQEEPRRHQTSWKGDVQTTDSTQPNQNTYQTTTGTSGWYQAATYDSWLNATGGGPKDASGSPFGFCEVQLWGAGYPNSRLAWNERYRVNDGAGAWQVLQTPTGWSAEIVDNPWPDDGGQTTPSPEPPNAGMLDQYFIQWYSDEYDNRILYSSYGNGVDEYVFEFKVDIIGEYPTTLEDPADGNAFESDGRLRVWFGGYVFDDNSGGDELFLHQDGTWYAWDDLPGLPEGFDGVMTIPEPATLGLLALGGAAALIRRRRK